MRRNAPPHMVSGSRAHGAPVTDRTTPGDTMTSFKHRLRRKRTRAGARKKALKAKLAKKTRRR